MGKLVRGTLSLTIIAMILLLTGGSLLVLGAIPVAAPLIGLPIGLFALGILARDGVVVAVGYGLIVITFVGIWLMRQATG